MENRKKFQEAVNTTTLSLVEKKELLCALFLLNETEQNEVRELITSEKNILQELSENLQAKKIALLAKNPDLWRTIMKKEESDVAKIA
jgi:hypothetical protein